MIGRMVAVCVCVVAVAVFAFDGGLIAGISRGDAICHRQAIGRAS